MLDAVNDAARSSLMPGITINLLEVMVFVRPFDSSQELRIDCRLSSQLGNNPEWLRNELAKIREAGEQAAEDFPEDSRDVICTRVNRRDGDGFCVWMLSWPTVMLWENFMGVDYEDFIDKSVMDAETRMRVGMRMDVVKESMCVIVRRLLGGG
jgi:hypothetical protein